ncbi:glycosyltransferase family 9 protein [Mesorhizobium sp. XAP10]|uniref:glycosyltransferase family 9 protein n=1 Tax=unclassified Mesorhizobium TaxID=325217 RepID=UPI0023DFB957|nr:MULTISPECIES: glycosyltransferase family 9 protein [unclassified Mesorhizobium]MDF3152807.1 glycosyltransferase family 9 protein [Mesorhizobium sp. XAP10]MDF3245183.1 glycosyltransferase family 9 protein [Mesorhizobium sp. XAP4]
MPSGRYETIILYSRNDAFGDGLIRIPALRAARTAFPDSFIVYGTTRSSSLEHSLNRHAGHLVDAINVRTPLARLIADHRKGKERFAVVDFRISARWLLQASASLLGRGIAYEANFPAFALSWRLGHRPEARPGHNAWRYHRLIERLAGKRLPFDHRLEPSPAARAAARSLADGKHAPLIIIAAHGSASKRMSADQVAAIADSLIADGANLLYVRTPGDGPDMAELAQRVPKLRLVDSAAIGGVDIGDILLALGEFADLYIGAEGGTAHLMATVMTPMVILNGGANMARWRPLSNCVDVIATRHASPTGLVADVPAPTIIEAAQRMLATRRRDHPHLPDLAGLSAQQPWGNDMREDVKRAV